jgi:hypothetical protein
MSILATLAALLTLPALAEDLVAEQAPSEIRIEATADGQMRVVNTTRRFETNLLATVADRQVIQHQLLEIEHRAEMVEGTEIERQFGEAHVRVTAYPLSAAGKGAPLFTVESSGDAVRVDGPYLTISHYGCCAEGSTDSIFSLETGQYLFNANGPGQAGDWVTMGARGGFENERILAYHLVPTPLDGQLFGELANGAAIISYARRDKPLQRVALVAPQEVFDAGRELDWLPRAGLLSADSAAPSDRLFIQRDGSGAEMFDGITYRLSLDDETVIDIPVTADRLDIAAAKLPEGYRLVEISLERRQ